jgi:Rne/Rng family ribonuclease
VGKKMARRDRPPIQRCLRRGDEIIVQIIKEGIGTKGPTLSTYLSIPGRILVMMPGMGKMGISKKIEDETERRRLRTILDSLKPPRGVGFIIRTAGIGRPKAEIQRDLTYLSRLWQTIEKKRDSGPGPMELYTEGDLVARTVRDVFSSDVDKIVVDNKDVAKRVKEVIKITSPRTRNKVELFEEPIPLFHKYDIERDIEQMYSRHVPLPSGGSLVIDSTEAIVAIDVNSGKFRDHSDAEMTAFKTDMEAADEIPRQLKLRDLGGVIICDFIDLRYERHRRELEERMHDNFKNDRAKTKVLRMSQFGIIELTRQRMRPSLKRSIYFDCPHCKGAGLVKTPESMSLDVMRRLAIAAANELLVLIELMVGPDVGFYLQNKKRASLARVEAESKKKILVRTEPGLGLDEMKLDLFDARDGLVIMDELGMGASLPHTTQLGTRAHGHPRGGRPGRGGDRGRGGQPPRPQGRQMPPPAPQRELDHEDERFDAEEAEEALAEHEGDHGHGGGGEGGRGQGSRGQESRDEDQIGARDRDGQQPVDVDAHDDVDEEDEQSDVVDVDDGNSELGERPEGEFDRYRDRGNRGGHRGGGGGGGGQGSRGEGSRGEEAGGEGGGRRRRRGRRGRGRGGPFNGEQQPAPAAQGARPPQTSQSSQPPRPRDERAPAPQGMQDFEGADDEGPAPGNQRQPEEGVAAGEAGGEEGGKRRRRRRRGGRRHRRRKDREANAGGDFTTAGDMDGAADAREANETESGAEVEVNRDAADWEAPSGRQAELTSMEDETAEAAPEDAGATAAEAEVVAEPPEKAPEPPVETDEPAQIASEPARVKKGRAPARRKSNTARKSPQRTPPPAREDAKAAAPSRSAPSHVVVEIPPVVSTGSADKHLANDEPVDPQPPRRPRRRDDLDEIPDDYD